MLLSTPIQLDMVNFQHGSMALRWRLGKIEDCHGDCCVMKAEITQLSAKIQTFDLTVFKVWVIRKDKPFFLSLLLLWGGDALNCVVSYLRF